MKLLSRIALAITIVACGVSLFYSYQAKQRRDDLRKDVADLTDTKTKLTKNLADAKTECDSTKQDLKKTNEDLGAVKGQLDGKTTELAQKTQDADKLKASLDSKTAEADQLKTERDTAQQDAKRIHDSLAAAGITDIKDLEQVPVKIETRTVETQILGKQLADVRNEASALKKQLTASTTTPPSLHGLVAAVQDDWGFVVLNVGHDKRVQPDTDFIVYRDTKMVAKVQVRSVLENTSVAEILPGFEVGTPRVGDVVVH